MHKEIESKEYLFKVGNGGFSLRKISPFINLSEKYDEYIQKNIVKTHDDFVPEDIFWSMLIPNVEEKLTVPNYEEALNFGFDRRPHLAYKYNEKKLPFGIHGIDKKNRIKFYKKICPDLK